VSRSRGSAVYPWRASSSRPPCPFPLHFFFFRSRLRRARSIGDLIDFEQELGEIDHLRALLPPAAPPAGAASPLRRRVARDFAGLHFLIDRRENRASYSSGCLGGRRTSRSALRRGEGRAASRAELGSLACEGASSSPGTSSSAKRIMSSEKRRPRGRSSASRVRVRSFHLRQGASSCRRGRCARDRSRARSAAGPTQ